VQLEVVHGTSGGAREVTGRPERNGDALPEREPTAAEIELQRAREVRLAQREARLAERGKRAWQPKLETPKSVLTLAVEAQLEPLIQAELADIAKLNNRDAQVMRLLVIRAMLSSRVSGLVRGMALWDKLKGVVQSDDDAAAKAKQRALDELDSTL
jgi:hypothetical protein